MSRPVPPTPPSPEVLPAGPDALLVRMGLHATPEAMAAAQGLAAGLQADPPTGALEIVPGLVSVLLRFDPARTPRAALAATLTERLRALDLTTQATLPPPRRRWTIPASFGGEDGPDLAGIATQLDLSENAAIARLCEADLRILAIGFAPGQPYLGLLPPAWDLPRLADLTPRVPAGAVVVAVRQIVIFGAASATGWRQVARTGFRSFVPDRDPPMPLRPGDAVRLAKASPAETLALRDDPACLGGARLEHLA